MRGWGALIITIFVISLAFAGSAYAANCGGDIACNCGDTLNESRILNSSDTLTGCAGNGLTISENHTTLDCAGLTINSTGSPGGNGIVIGTGVVNATVKNCTVSGFYNGLDASYNGDNSTILYNTFFNNSYNGISWQVTSGATFLSNNISSNGMHGMRVDSCFLSGTKILMADGTMKSIEDVREGDLIVSYGEKTGQQAPGRVKKTFYHERTEGYLVINSNLKLTPNHPMYVNGVWKPAGEIAPGDLLLDSEGSSVPVETIEYVNEVVPTYNLEVSGYHNYYANGILTHNKCPRIFTHNGEDYEFDLLINVAQFGEENSRLYSYPVKHMAEPKILMEYEPSEVNYVDFIKIKVTDKAVQPGLQDRLYILNPISCISESGCDLSDIDYGDGIYLVLDEGRPEYYIEFEPIPELEEGYERTMEMVSDGYQIRVGDADYLSAPVYVKEFMREYVETGRLNSYHTISGNTIHSNGFTSMLGEYFGIAFLNAESHGTITGNDIRYNEHGLYLGSSINVTVEGNNVTNNTKNGILLDTVGAGINVTRNNVYNNTWTQANATAAIELSINGQGNYWGRSCPTRLFIPGTDSNAADVVDSYAYREEYGWLTGQPGCCGTVITSSVTLDQDLTNCAGNAINISGSDISLDCNGHTLSGTGPGAYTEGIYRASGYNITVKNCTVTDYYNAIYINGGAPNVITYNTISAVYDAINPGTSAFIAYNMIFNTTGTAIYAGSDSVVQNNTLWYTDEGIYTGYENNVTIVDNFINATAMRGSGDHGCGIVVGFSGDDIVVANNTIINSEDRGIYERKTSGDVNITGNTITDSGNFGIDIVNVTSHTLRFWHNNVYSNSLNVQSLESLFGSVVPVELSYNYEGNFWGKTGCPTFIPGVDSNDASVIDHYAYNASDGWLTGLPQDCPGYGPPVVTSVSVSEPDNFYSPCSGNDVVNIQVNTTGVSNLSANFSEISAPGGIDCGGGGDEINLSYQGGGVFNGTCNVSAEAALSDFVGGPVILVALNLTGGFAVDSSMSIVLYNMTTPAAPQMCERDGPNTTNFCNITDFAHVNFVQEVEMNGSAACNTETVKGLPWGDTFNRVIMLNFSDINFSDPNIGQKMGQLGNAIQPYITGPGQFGDSYIYVNTTAFAELNTSTTITMYGLPFTGLTEANIVGPGGVSGVSFTANTPYLMEITCTDICTSEGYCPGEPDCSTCIATCTANGEAFNMTVPNGDLEFTVVGFSQYNISDNLDPIITINDPANGSSMALGNVTVNVTVNGTGTQLSNLTALINGQTLFSYSNSNLFNNCNNETDDWTVVTCNHTYVGAAGGSYTLTAIATDFGNVSGNTAVLNSNFALDDQGPSVTITSPEATGYNYDFNVNATVVDAYSTVDKVFYRWENATENGTWVEMSNSSPTFWEAGFSISDLAVGGVYTFRIYANDTLGNTNQGTSVSGVTVKPYCGVTIMSNTVLDADITGCGGNGLIIGANGVTLNCAGHEISKSGHSDYGVYSAFNSTTVSNCVIHGFETGIYLDNSFSNTLTGNTVYDNYGITSGIYLNIVNDSIITNNNASYNDVGIHLDTSCNNLVQDNIASFNTAGDQIGIYVESESHNNTVYSNTLSGNTDYGISVDTSNDNSITGNTVTNSDVGIYLTQADSTTVGSNTVKFSGTAGIEFSTANATVTGNTICYNGDTTSESGTNSFTMQDNIYCIILKSPVDGYNISGSSSLGFTYYPSNVIDQSSGNCTLYIDGSQSNLTAITSVIYSADNSFTNINVSYGTHKWQVKCNDTGNNHGTSGFFMITTTPPTNTNTASVTTTAGTATTQAFSNVNTSIDFYTTNGETADVTVNEYSSLPAGSSAFVAAGLGRYVTITSALTSMEWAIVKVYYTDSEVSSAGLDESTLRLYYYNLTSDSWAVYDSPNGGVNTTGNYVWANTTHVSLWGIGGSAAAAAPAAPTIPSAPQYFGCTVEWICEEWTACQPDGTRSRFCVNNGTCKTTVPENKTEVESCGYIETCYDGMLNGDETDLDCGGSCPDCADGKSCLVDDDCQGNCNPDTKKCYTPPCTPGTKRCLGNDLQQCGADEKWATQVVCEHGCNPDTFTCRPMPPEAPELPTVDATTLIIIVVIVVIAIAVVFGGMKYMSRPKAKAKKSSEAAA